MLLHTLKLSLHSFSLKIKLIIRNPKAIIDWSIGVEYNNISDIVLGEGVRIHKGTVLTARNNSSREQGLLKIGRNTYIGENNIIRASGGVKIGDNCLISNNVVIVSENHGTKLGIPITKQSSATKKGVTAEKAQQLMETDYMFYACLMCKCGDADGAVSGACHSTGNTIRPALQLDLNKVTFDSTTNTFTVEETASYSVTVTAGSNMTKTETSGEAEQTGLTGAMTDVVYTANEGYYFPENYSVTAVNGISVTRDSYTQITVSGTPTADATIALTAPTEKSKEATPTATFQGDYADGNIHGDGRV